jgi:hypothetical protein
VVEGINHEPYVHIPGATYKTFPCESVIGQDKSVRIIHAVNNTFICQKILFVPTMNLSEDSVNLIKGFKIGDIDEMMNGFVNPNLMVVSITTNFGLVLLPDAALYGIKILFNQTSLSFYRTYCYGSNLTITGTMKNINKALETLTYIPTLGVSSLS